MKFEPKPELKIHKQIDKSDFDEESRTKLAELSIDLDILIKSVNDYIDECEKKQINISEGKNSPLSIIWSRLNPELRKGDKKEVGENDVLKIRDVINKIFVKKGFGNPKILDWEDRKDFIDNQENKPSRKTLRSAWGAAQRHKSGGDNKEDDI